MKKIQRRRAEFSSVKEMLTEQAALYGDQVVFSYRNKPSDELKITVTLEDLLEDVRELGTELISMGTVGKHCAVIGKLTYNWIRTYLAMLSIGAVIVPLDRDWTSEELATTIDFADCEYVFFDSDIESKIAPLMNAENSRIKGFYCLDEKSEQTSLSALAEHGRQSVENGDTSFDDCEINAFDVAKIVFTSGTTGKGKGVMLTHKNLLSDLGCAVEYIADSCGNKSIAVLPPHHTYGSTINILGHICIPAELYLSSGLRYIVKELKAEKPTHLVLVPLYLETFYRKIWTNIKDQGKEALVNSMIRLCNAIHAPRKMRLKLFSSIHAAFGGNVKMIITGGAPVNPDILHFFQSIGISVLNGYGITECAPLIAVNRSNNVVAGSVGNVIDMDEVFIDEPNEDGEGEILVKGPNVMLGYYKNDKATSEAMNGEYFRTGDYGKIENGVLFITGRKKNLIILSNGKNVYPEEIENELIATPGILDIIVYEGQSKRGISHNAIVAEVFPDKDFLEKNGIEDVKAHLKPYIDEYNKNAVAYKKIGVLKIRSTEFPKNTLRKIMRFKLDMSID